MEWVKGDPLTSFCEDKQLSLPARIDLIQQICAAVQHAHQKGVVHRDLTPRNVLVAEDGGTAKAKIIDFGLAKAIGPSIGNDSLISDARIILGTPGYMAPEQADPTNGDIDTRADIYSIGVMLYELLVGSLPIEGLHERGILDMQQTLRETDPQRPSTRVGTHKVATTHIATISGMTSNALRKALKQDLDWIVLKAIATDPNRRYESASALAADLQRFLDDEPVQAGPPSMRYVLTKALCKYRRSLMIAAAVVIALATGLVVAVHQASVASAQRKVAEDAWDRYGTLSGFVELLQGLGDEALFVEDTTELPRIEKWIEDVEGYLAKRTEYEERLRQLKARARTTAGSLKFDIPADQFEHRIYQSLLKELTHLSQTALPRAKNSANWLRKVRDLTIANHKPAWDRVIAAVSADYEFGDFELTPQEGLVPIGKNPHSDLEEFWMPRSGTRPERTQDGHLIVTPKTGIVLVLLPPGTVKMGSVARMGEDPRSWKNPPNERPRHRVELAPFFIGKYEVTQGQWRGQSFAGTNPNDSGKGDTGHYPVTRVSYEQAKAVLRWHRLVLPTEAQWEYACRGGTLTKWWCGDRRGDLLALPSKRGRINIASNGQREVMHWPEYNDGCRYTTAVGWARGKLAAQAFEPNPFGLYLSLIHI